MSYGRSVAGGGFWLPHASTEARQLIAFADELAQLGHGEPGVNVGPVNSRPATCARRETCVRFVRPVRYVGS